jgi:CRISPR-associated endonuclease/helicase Cas3
MDYANEFATVVPGKEPHGYQKRAAEHLFQRRHLILRAPTGAGKTLSVLVPFLVGRGAIGVRGMIYVLPLRTLAEAIYKEACDLGETRGFTVTMQTGERADAEFFHDADIIITTFDQLLSGLLCEPYGLSTRLWNINAAAMAGKLIVFDEFHLMGPAEAFVTALFGVGMFKNLCVSVWMTATATSPLTDRIRSSLDAVEVELSPGERTALFEGRNISRSLCTSWDCCLTAEEVLKHQNRRLLVVVNTVGRAQELFEKLESRCPALLLHSRFFPDDRRDKQLRLKDARLIIATQVIEAGVDISSEVLLTEIAPVNALVQRAGRCARFSGESGMVHVYAAPSRYPYAQADLDAATAIVKDTDSLNPTTCADWVERAHKDADGAAISGYAKHVDSRRDLIKGHVIGNGSPGASAYIRPGNDAVRVFILDNPTSVKPQARQALQLYRQKVRSFQDQAWTYDGESWVAGGDVLMAYAVALPPSIAGYTKEKGLVLNAPGTIQSPTKPPRNRPGYPPLKAEPWANHTQGVVDESVRRVGKEGLGDQFLPLAVWTARLHDLGKLQHIWQEWARARQAARNKEVSNALAHTDYDWQTDRGEPRPPKHAAASGLYGDCCLGQMTNQERVAVLLAVISHHGGTLSGPCTADKLHISANEALERAGLAPLNPANPTTFFRDLGDDMVDRFDEIWPLAAILSRILRLADQKATAEASVE